MQAMVSIRNNVMGGIGGQIDGLDADKSCLAMGQSAGGIHDVLPAAQIVANILAEASGAIGRVGAIAKADPVKV
jgi:enoyl-[acyl-carrier protein] reductase II